MTVKLGYKQSEVGVIPDDWDAVNLQTVCSMKSGESITSANIDGFSKYPCFGGNGLRGYTKRFTHDGAFALIGRQGALCGNVVRAQGRFFASEHAVVVTAQPGTDVAFLTYVLGRMRLNRFSESSAQPGLSVSKVLKLALAVPPNEAEQRSIATALTDVDDLLTSLDRLIAKKRAIKQGVMHDLLTGRKRLSGSLAVASIPDGWDSVTIGDIASKVGSGITPTGGSQVYGYAGRPFIRSQNVGWGTLLLDDMAHISDTIHATFVDTELRHHDVLLNITGASIGRSAVAESSIVGGNVNQHVCIIRAQHSAADPLFVNSVLLSPLGQRQIAAFQAGGNRQGLNFQQVRSIRIPLPTLPEQRAIAAVLTDLDDEIDALQARRDKTHAIKQAMMAELLTGRTRLI